MQNTARTGVLYFMQRGEFSYYIMQQVNFSTQYNVFVWPVGKQNPKVNVEMWKAMFMNMIRWKWVNYFFCSHSELVIMFTSPQFAQIICFLLCCLQMNRLHWSHFIDADEFFLLHAYEAASPFLRWPISDAISIIFHRKWTIFFKKCGNISRQWRYLRSWDDMLFH